MRDKTDGDADVESAAGDRDSDPDGDRDRGATKRRRMQQLIQRSIDMASARAPASDAPAADAKHATTANTSAKSCSSSSSSAIIAGGKDNGDGQAPQRARRKCTWTPEEDTRLQELVKRLGTAQWAKVAAHFPSHDRKRCRERFVNQVDPQLRRRAWTTEEDTQLLALQRELGSRWADIARRLRGRSPEDAKNRCLLLLLTAQSRATAAPVMENAEHSASVSSPSLQDREIAPPVASTRATPAHWSTAEAETLRALVGAHGATNWLFIASHLPGRTDVQCMQHWFQVLDPVIAKGKGSWSAQDDALLAQKVEELGPKWTQIARLLPGRVGKQCRERYLNHVDPSLTKTPWTSEEDARLTELCEQHANRWSHIAKEFPGRSENAIKNRWHKLARNKLLVCHSDATTG